ncbi:MAG: IS110 family transposase [Bacteroidetes bacterium]|nr:MAG: IS110 family transposase [Bacteroidota bacterium]
MKQIYGIDLSKEKFNVSFIDLKGFLKGMEVNNNYSGICKFLAKIQKDAILCIEYTGIYGDLLVFLANCFNISICAIPGYEIKHSLGMQKGKSDPIDASKIREYGERFSDKLKETVFYSEQLHELRELHSLRDMLVKQRKMLQTHGKEKNRAPYCSVKVKLVSQEILRTLDKQIREVENQIQEVINADPELAENSRLIQSIKGIGAVTANELIIKTHNFKKINTARKAASFAGVCPFPNSSGKMVKKSKVSPMSDKKLKTLLFLCASSAIQNNKDMKHYYERKIAEGKPGYLALNNVANKLLRTVYAIIESKQMWDPLHICLDPREGEKKAA